MRVVARAEREAQREDAQEMTETLEQMDKAAVGGRRGQTKFKSSGWAGG